MEAARAGGMTALGVARKGDASVLCSAGADVVVTSLDEIAIDELAAGRLSRRAVMIAKMTMAHGFEAVRGPRLVT